MKRFSKYLSTHLVVHFVKPKKESKKGCNVRFMILAIDLITLCMFRPVLKAFYECI